jgi:hypothetical protein
MSKVVKREQCELDVICFYVWYFGFERENGTCVPCRSVELERLGLDEDLVAVGAGERGAAEAPGVEHRVALVAAGELPALHAAEGTPERGERRRQRRRRRRGRRGHGGLRVERRRSGDGRRGGVVGGPERPARRAAGGAAVHHRGLLGAADGPRARHAPADTDTPLLVPAAAALLVAGVLVSCRRHCWWRWLSTALAGRRRAVRPHGHPRVRRLLLLAGRRSARLLGGGLSLDCIHWWTNHAN